MKPLAMWETWQQEVKLALPNFCQHPWFVSQPSMYPEFEKTAEYVRDQCQKVRLGGKMLGAEYGATLVDTQAEGRITRMWLDSMCEVNFLAKHLPLETLRILDIGAGYGRLAAALGTSVRSFTCTDAVPISRFICEYFTMKHCPSAKVVVPESLGDSIGMFDLAVNIHSWSECSFESVEEWLKVIEDLEITHLFTVAHDDRYSSWAGPSFRPAIEKGFSLVAEEVIGLAPTGMAGFPHALWKRL